MWPKAWIPMLRGINSLYQKKQDYYMPVSDSPKSQRVHFHLLLLSCPKTKIKLTTNQPYMCTIPCLHVQKQISFMCSVTRGTMRNETMGWSKAHSQAKYQWRPLVPLPWLNINHICFQRSCHTYWGGGVTCIFKNVNRSRRNTSSWLLCVHAYGFSKYKECTHHCLARFVSKQQRCISM